MKSIIWLIYVSSIVIMRIQADVQDADTSVCTLCEDTTIPKCESTDNAKLDKQIDCKEKGCVIAENSETNYVCVLEIESMADTQLTHEAIEDHTQAATVLPVPVALQMVTTETAESDTEVSKEVNNAPVEIMGNANAEAENNEKVEEQSEVAKHVEAQQEHSEDNDATPDKEKEPQPVETEHNAEQAVEAGVEEITDMQENAETPQVDAEDVAVVQPVAEEEEEAAVQPDNGSQSPDYPADAPAINVEETNVDVESPPMTAAKPEDAEQMEPQNTNDANDGDDGNKDETVTNNHDEQTALNGGVTAVMENNDDSAHVDEPEIPDHNVEPQIVDNTASSNAANAPPTVIVDNISPPANTEQFLSCYSCSSTTDAKCAPGPGRAMNCQATGNKQNGCYTLYKADTNVTTRGCISELTNEGLKFCKSNSKQCILCYEKGCNKLLAPSAANQSNSQLSIWLGIISFMLVTYML
ncbi:myb-like protein X isoform X1 [Zeugodacus cucurbitae]|uniref:Midasin n=2 Tax=Zeugodacus cucurbitae TaxID=28588 RepID=A0A0A1WDJ8_ZEUCU|nr:myb-like protein X isoform X1 [Zeugodacus cucurbitae]